MGVEPGDVPVVAALSASLLLLALWAGRSAAARYGPGPQLLACFQTGAALFGTSLLLLACLSMTWRGYHPGKLVRQAWIASSALGHGSASTAPVRTCPDVPDLLSCHVLPAILQLPDVGYFPFNLCFVLLLAGLAWLGSSRNQLGLLVSVGCSTARRSQLPSAHSCRMQRPHRLPSSWHSWHRRCLPLCSWHCG